MLIATTHVHCVSLLRYAFPLITKTQTHSMAECVFWLSLPFYSLIKIICLSTQSLVECECTHNWRMIMNGRATKLENNGNVNDKKTGGTQYECYGIIIYDSEKNWHFYRNNGCNHSNGQNLPEQWTHNSYYTYANENAKWQQCLRILTSLLFAVHLLSFRFQFHMARSAVVVIICSCDPMHLHY